MANEVHEILEDNKWQVYSSKRRRNKRTSAHPTTLVSIPKPSSLFYLNDLYPDCNESQLLLNFTRHQNHVKQNCQTFLTELVSQVQQAAHLLSSTLESPILIMAAYCLGLGNPANNQDSLSQLSSFDLLLQELKIEPCNCEIYEPLFRVCAVNFLKQQLGYRVLSNNEEGYHDVDESGFTLVFFPHCHKGLVNNFLYENWTTARLNHLILIADWSQSDEVISNAPFRYLYQWRKHAKYWSLPPNSPTGWDGLAVQCLPSELHLKLSSEFWARDSHRPCYDSCEEFGEFIRGPCDIA